MKVTALAGGTGSAKLLRGLAKLDLDLTVVANVGDNYWVYGLYVCPDVDIATYALAGVLDRSRGWGIEGDTFRVLEQLASLGEDTWFRLGDRDMATSVLRTRLLREGRTLTEATEAIGRSLGVRARVLPACDKDVSTQVVTPAGRLHLQEFWVRDKGAPEVLGVEYRGKTRSALTDKAKRAVDEADVIVLCPANPVTSIGPILSVRGMKEALTGTKARVVAVSPMVGEGPFSGPAGKFMKALGFEPDSLGVAKRYSSFLDAILIAQVDAAMKVPIGRLGVKVGVGDTTIRHPRDEIRLASEVLKL